MNSSSMPVALVLLVAVVSALIPQSQAKHRIAFGSCNKPHIETPIWDLVAQRNPSAFIFLGDIIYGDMKSTLPIFKETNISHIRSLYDKQWQIPEFANLVQQMQFDDNGNANPLKDDKGNPVFPLMGIYDDHDYGLNDGDKTLSFRSESKQAVLDFLRVPEDDPRRNHFGAYGSHLIDFARSPLAQNPEVSQKVMVILLDLRFNKDPYNVGLTKGGFLGREQIEWLDSLLKKSSADAHVIVSTLQVMPEKKTLIHDISEYWARFPVARQQLLKILKKHKLKAPILVSGDVHYAELSEANCGLGKRMVEVTSSGITHSWGGITFLRKLFEFYMWVIPQPYQVIKSWDRNFGELEFDFETQPQNPTLTTRLFSESGDLIAEKTYDMSKLILGEIPTIFYGDVLKQANAMADCRPTHGMPDKNRIKYGSIFFMVALLISFLFILNIWRKIVWYIVTFLFGGNSSPKFEEEDDEGEKKTIEEKKND